MKKLLLFVIVAMLLVGCVACKKKSDNVNYYEDDLSPYVEIEEKYYKGYTVNLDPDRVSDIEVENKIVQTLRRYKSSAAVEGDGVITAGDVVHIYYKGYYKNADGTDNYFAGGDNTADTKPYELEIGSGGFILGFEYNLVGKKPADYSAENPIVVETYFPDDYNSAELAGKTAWFIVTVEKLVEYSAPELNDAFITGKLKLSEENLSSFAGSTMVEKYKSYVREQIMYEEGLDRESLALDAFWTSVLANAKIKAYPQKQVDEMYDKLVAELDSYYEYYSSVGYNYSYDDFVCAYLGIEKGTNWKNYVTDIAKNQVKQQLIFYHIMSLEDLKPSKEEYDALYEKYLNEELEANGITANKYSGAEEFTAAKKEYEDKVLQENGADYFKSLIYYDIIIDAVISYANYVEISK